MGLDSPWSQWGPVYPAKHRQLPSPSGPRLHMPCTQLHAGRDTQGWGTLASPRDTGTSPCALRFQSSAPAGMASRVQSCDSGPQGCGEPSLGTQGGLPGGGTVWARACAGCDEANLVSLTGSTKLGPRRGLVGLAVGTRLSDPTGAHQTGSQARTGWGLGTPGRRTH